MVFHANLQGSEHLDGLGGRWLSRSGRAKTLSFQRGHPLSVHTLTQPGLMPRLKAGCPRRPGRPIPAGVGHPSALTAATFAPITSIAKQFCPWRSIAGGMIRRVPE